MEEDLRKLSFFEMQSRIWTDERKIDEQSLVIDALRSESKAAKEKPATPYTTTEGDVETWHNLPVLVPVGLIPEGRTPCEVRSLLVPYIAEWLSHNGDVMAPAMGCNISNERGGSLRILLADKPAPVDPPLFEVGKCYKNRRGEIRGPLRATLQCSGNAATHPLSDVSWVYMLNGDRSKFHGGDHSFDLIPGPVDPPPTWTPPQSLPDGVYAWLGRGMEKNGEFMGVPSAFPKSYRDWSDPPKVGRWRVENGTATWLGES